MGRAVVASQRCVERSGTMFSANKITGMTVVLSETLKEIIHKNDVSQDEHPFSALNCKKNQNVKYLATKPWEHVQRGEKPADAGLYPCSGYTGHVPAARETHGASYQSSIKLAQRASFVEHYSRRGALCGWGTFCEHTGSRLSSRGEANPNATIRHDLSTKHRSWGTGHQQNPAFIASQQCRRPEPWRRPWWW